MAKYAKQTGDTVGLSKRCRWYKHSALNENKLKLSPRLAVVTGFMA